MEKFKKIKFFLLNLNKLLLLYINLNYYYWKFSFYFLQKFIGCIICFFYFLQYIFLIFFKNFIIYFLIVFNFIIREKFINLRKKKNFLKFKYNKVIKKNKEIKKNKSFIEIWYINRWMLKGFLIVYIQIFMRKIKDIKYYLIYVFNNKIKRKYIYFKKYILSFTLFVYVYNNYYLVIYFENLKKKIKYIYFFFIFMRIYNINNLKKKKNIIIFFFLNLTKKLKKMKKWI